MTYPKVLLVLDLQNDLCHKDGVFKKHGLAAYAQLEPLLPNIIDAINFAKQNSIPVIASQLTILVDLKKEPIGINHLKFLRPFLESEGLREGSWGHDILEGLSKPDYKVQKWGLSPFYHTTLSWYLKAFLAKELILCGFSTNGVVESTGREAISRGFKITTLTDCVTSYSESLHQASLSNLGSFGKLLTSKDWQKALQ